MPTLWNSHPFVPTRTSILPQPVRNAAMTMILMLPTLYSSERWGIPATSPWHAITDSARNLFLFLLPPWRDRARDLALRSVRTWRQFPSQHWARFCIVPVLVANILSPSPNPVKSLDQLARVDTAGCVIASHILHQFRRLLLEHGGMQHAPSSVPLSVPEWLTRLHDNALQAIPTRFLPEPVSPVRPQSPGAGQPKSSLLHANRRQ